MFWLVGDKWWWSQGQKIWIKSLRHCSHTFLSCNFYFSVKPSSQRCNYLWLCWSFCHANVFLGGSFLLDRVSHHPMLSTFNITIAALEAGEEPKTLANTHCGLPRSVVSFLVNSKWRNTVKQHHQCRVFFTMRNYLLTCFLLPRNNQTKQENGVW